MSVRVPLTVAAAAMILLNVASATRGEDPGRMNLIDAHVHVWTPDTVRYPLAPGFTKTDMKPASFTPEELFKNCKPAGVGRINLIQMSFYGFDNTYMLDMIAKYPGVFVGTAVINPLGKDPAREMQELARRGVRAFRIYPKLTGEPADKWLRSRGYDTMFAAAARNNQAMACLIDPDALPELDRMCTAYPHTPVIIDHLCRIGSDGVIRDEDVDRLCAMAKHKNVMVKVGAFYALGKKEPPYTDLAPLIKRVVRAFGPNRCMWESDCPFQVQGRHTYQASVDLVQKRLDFLSDDDREWLLRKTAEHVLFTKPDSTNESTHVTPAATLPVVRPEKLREDFRILRTALEEGHPGIYRYTPKAELDQRFDEAEKALDRPMNVYEFYRAVAPAVAALKCGHTGVRLSRKLGKDTLLLPLLVRVLNGKVYVVRDLSGKKAAGNEIVAINGVPAGKIVQTMLAATPGDGDVETARLRRIGGASFARNLGDVLGIASPYTVTFVHGQNGDKTVRLEGIEAAKFREGRPKESATLTFTDDGTIAVLKINRFGGTANNKPLGKFIQESFAEIDKKKSGALVLDLRDNGGGADELGKLLLSFLITEPFRYYDDLVLNALDFTFRKYTAQKRALPAEMMERQPNGKYRLVKHPNWGIQQPGKPSFTGKVYILINGNSFSTTSEFLSHAHARKRATFIGEESGGGYYGNTSGPGALLTLPNTKLQAYVPLMTYYMAVRDYKAASHGVVPDYPVSYTIEELLRGTDKEMALALELARKK